MFPRASWRRLTGRPQPTFEFDGVAWAALPGMEPDADPVCDAIDRAEAGDREAAWQMLMDVLGADLRCLDAHAHPATWCSSTRPGARSCTTRSACGWANFRCRWAATGCWR